MTAAAISEMYERNVVQAGEWARAHSAALARVYAAFAEEGEWPKAETLQREINRSGDTHDLITELQEMPASLGVVQHEGRVALSIRGLSTVPQAEPLLTAYMAVIELAVDRYRGEEEKPRVGDGDLRDALGMEEGLAKRVGVLVFSEGWPFGSGGGEADGSWYRDVPIELRHLIGTTDIGGFLAVQAKLRYGSSGLSRDWKAQLESAATTTPVVVAEADTVRPREARSPSLSPTILRQLVFKELAKLEAEHYFVEGFAEGEHHALAHNGVVIASPPSIEDPEAWLMLNLNVEGLWPQLQDPSGLANSSSSSQFDDKDCSFACSNYCTMWSQSRPSTQTVRLKASTNGARARQGCVRQSHRSSNACSHRWKCAAMVRSWPRALRAWRLWVTNRFPHQMWPTTYESRCWTRFALFET